jgi:hypothetical protein
VQRFAARLFVSVTEEGEAELSQFDLFHCHLVAAESSRGTRCLALLFHTREYPASVPWAPPLGYCQKGSTLEWCAARSARRNYLYVVRASKKRPRYMHGALAQLDCSPGTVLHGSLLLPDLAAAHTLLESDFGRVLCDVNYAAWLTRGVPETARVFVCPY